MLTHVMQATRRKIAVLHHLFTHFNRSSFSFCSSSSSALQVLKNSSPASPPPPSPPPSAPSPAVTATTFSSLLPPSINPFNTAVDLVCSHLKQLRRHCQEATLDEALAPHVRVLRPDDVVRILLRSQSLPVPSLRFFLWSRSRLPFPPPPRAYSVLIHVLAHSHYFSYALVLLSDFLEGLPSADAAFRVLLDDEDDGSCNRHPVAISGMIVKVFVKMRRIEAALDACRRALRMGFVPDVNAFNSLLHALAKSSRLDECWAIYGDMRRAAIVPNSYTFNILIRALCQGEDAGRAREFLEEMESEGFDPDIVTYNTLIDGYCRKGRLEDAFYLHRIMHIRGVEPDLVSYTILMGGLCKHGSVVEAQQLFDKMLRKGLCPDSYAYNVLVRGYCKEGRLSEARSIVPQMLSSSLRPDMDTIIKAHVKDRKLLPCLNLLGLLRKIGIAVSFDSYKLLVVTLCMENRPNAARSLLRSMLVDGYESTAEIYDALICSFCKCNFLEDALSLKDEMYSRQLRPDLDTFRCIISCLCRLDRSLEAELLVQEMLDSGLKPDSNICELLIRECCKLRDLCRAESLLTYFVNKFQIYDHKSYNALLGLCSEVADATALLDLHDRMLRMGFKQNAQTCNLMIHGLLKQKHSGLVEC